MVTCTASASYATVAGRVHHFGTLPWLAGGGWIRFVRQDVPSAAEAISDQFCDSTVGNMHAYSSKQSGFFPVILALVITLLGAPVSPANAGAPASADVIPRALSPLIVTSMRVSVNSSGVQGNDNSLSASISADGRYVAFYSRADNLVSGDTNGVEDVFLRDTQAGTTTRVSVASDGTQANGWSIVTAISGDGRYVAFDSGASNLVSGDTNGVEDVFLRDTQAGTTTRVSVASDGKQGNIGSFFPSISTDGRYVAFVSDASNLVSGDTNGTEDIFLRDTLMGNTTIVSVDSGGVQGDDYSLYPSISADGHYVAFYSEASNLVSGDLNGSSDIFVRDTQMGNTALVSVAADGTQGNGRSYSPSISGDGRYVAFWSDASNLVSGDMNGGTDIFVRDTQTGKTTLVSVATDGTQGNFWSRSPSISADGRYVAFESVADNLVSGDGNDADDVFIHDMQKAATVRLSLNSSGIQGNGWSQKPSISADGRYVAFESDANNLGSGDTNGMYDVFVVPATIYKLTARKAGTGCGTITSNLPGITCGAVCAYAYTTGTTFKLSAAAGSGSHFSGWSGDGCTGKGACTLTMDADKTVSARFSLDVSKTYMPMLGR